MTAIVGFASGCIVGAVAMLAYTRWARGRALQILTAVVDTHVRLLEAETAAQARREEEEQPWAN